MRELHTIEVDRYVPSERKGIVKHVGMISPQAAFDALKKHLEASDMLPDEYFNPNRYEWKDVPELPNYFRASCDVKWGGSEGIYLDIDLLYRDENKQLQHFHFATGKTLGQTGDDFLRMSRIAAECSMMLNGRGEVVRFYEEEKKDMSEIENKKVYSLQEIADWPYQVCDLIATYEGLYNIPTEQQVTVYFGDYGSNFFKSPSQGATPERISNMFNKALCAMNMTADEFLAQKDNFVYRSEIERVMQGKTKESLNDKIASAEKQPNKSPKLQNTKEELSL